jgi:tripartite-type tricarboxylate transporter receptor subunit TctC
LVVAAAPGGGTDILGRMMAQRLSDRLGQAFVVENKGGGGGSVAADFVAKSAANGHTLLVTNDQLTVGASFAGASNYDVLKDFAPIGLIGRTSIVVGVNPSVPANNVGELIALVRANPGKYSFSSCGHGTPLHLAGELLNLSARIDMVHVPYRGAAPAEQDLMASQVDFFLAPYGKKYLDFNKAGKLKVLAMLNSTRLDGVKEFAAVGESKSLKDFTFNIWTGYFVKKDTPEPVVVALHKAISETLADPTVHAGLDANSLLTAQPLPLAAVAKVYADGTAQFRAIAKSINLQAQ